MKDTTFDPDAVVAAARAADGLEDFGDDSYRQPLEQLLWSLEHEARLNATGRAVLRQRMVDILATRLRVQHYLQRFPEIRDEEITAPLFIVGLPRTGTTMLHRTIAADHRMYAPLWYEVRYPSPAPDWDFTTAGDSRIAAARAEMAAMLEANPDLLAIHPMDAMGPDEDIMLLEQSFYSFNTQAYANIPSFDAWIEAAGPHAGLRLLPPAAAVPAVAEKAQRAVRRALDPEGPPSPALHGSCVQGVSGRESGTIPPRSGGDPAFADQPDSRGLDNLLGFS